MSRAMRLPRHFRELEAAFEADAGRAEVFINCREGDPVLVFTVDVDGTGVPPGPRRQFEARGSQHVLQALEWLKGRVPR